MYPTLNSIQFELKNHSIISKHLHYIFSFIKQDDPEENNFEDEEEEEIGEDEETDDYIPELST